MYIMLGSRTGDEEIHKKRWKAVVTSGQPKCLSFSPGNSKLILYMLSCTFGSGHS